MAEGLDSVNAEEVRSVDNERVLERQMDWLVQVRDSGYGIVGSVFGTAKVKNLATSLASAQIPRSRAGIRHVMSTPHISEIARSEEMQAIACAVLGDRAIPFRATLFDKSPNSNWLVAWHQDTALPLKERRERTGWGPWSIKDGVIYAHAPAHALERLIALRLHLDESNSKNGPLRVLPGTHRRGILRDEQVHELSETVQPVDCCIGAGGVVLMRPLIVHASSKSLSQEPRRVLHIEYAPSLEIDEGLQLAVA